MDRLHCVCRVFVVLLSRFYCPVLLFADCLYAVAVLLSQCFGTVVAFLLLLLWRCYGAVVALF